MRIIPDDLIFNIRERTGFHRIDSAFLRNTYTNGRCHRLADALMNLHPDTLVPWVLCNKPQSYYEAWQDFLEDDGIRPGETWPSGHAFVKIKGTELVLDIEGLRPFELLRQQSRWCKLPYNFPVMQRDFQLWGFPDSDLDVAVAESLYAHYIGGTS